MRSDIPASRGADVVTVPDFRGPARELFEARTLLFLGSWLENAGSAADWPLHLACIGEPPPRVVALAERCGAEVTVHPPAAQGMTPTCNKLRGLEVRPRTDRVLLLDADVIVFGDPGPLLDLGRCLAVAPAGNHRVSVDTWERVHRALGEPMPEERIPCLRAELADRLPPLAMHGSHHLRPMVPYYNSGVLLAPWDRVPDLKKHWETYLERLGALFPIDRPENRKISLEDQVAFALALRRLEARGAERRRLPHALHATWLHLMAGTLRPEEVRLYHAVHLFRLGDGPEAGWPAEVEAYERFILEHVYPPTWRGRLLRMLRRAAGEPAGVTAIRALCARIRTLVHAYLPPPPSAGFAAGR